MAVTFLGASSPGEAQGFFTRGYVGYFPSGVSPGLGPIIDFSDFNNSMYAAIVSAFV